MKRRYTGFFAGLVCGAVLFGGTAAYAAGVLAERSSHKVTGRQRLSLPPVRLARTCTMFEWRS